MEIGNPSMFGVGSGPRSRCRRRRQREDRPSLEIRRSRPVLPEAQTALRRDRGRTPRRHRRVRRRSSDQKRRHEPGGHDLGTRCRKRPGFSWGRHQRTRPSAVSVEPTVKEDAGPGVNSGEECVSPAKTLRSPSWPPRVRRQTLVGPSRCPRASRRRYPTLQLLVPVRREGRAATLTNAPKDGPGSSPTAKTSAKPPHRQPPQTLRRSRSVRRRCATLPIVELSIESPWHSRPRLAFGREDGPSHHAVVQYASERPAE